MSHKRVSWKRERSAVWDRHSPCFDNTMLPFMSVPGELSAALVLSKCASARLDSVDASEALSLPGVVAFVDHRCETARVIGQALNTFFLGTFLE